jgi:hypothetical protein
MLGGTLGGGEGGVVLHGGTFGGEGIKINVERVEGAGYARETPRLLLAKNAPSVKVPLCGPELTKAPGPTPRAFEKERGAAPSPHYTGASAVGPLTEGGKAPLSPKGPLFFTPAGKSEEARVLRSLSPSLPSFYARLGVDLPSKAGTSIYIGAPGHSGGLSPATPRPAPLSAQR